MADTSVTTHAMELRGMEALRRSLRETPELVRDEVARVVARSTFAMAQRVRGGAPVETGTLKASIGSSSTAKSGRVTIGPTGFYWKYLEYGRLGVAAYPFIRPAGELESIEFERQILNIGRALEAAWTRAA